MKIPLSSAQALFFLASFWPWINFLSVNTHEFQKLGPYPFAVIFLICGALWAGVVVVIEAAGNWLAHAIKQRIYWVATFSVFLFFSYGALRPQLIDWIPVLRIPSLGIGVNELYLFLVAVLLCSVWRLSVYEMFSRAATVFVATMLVVPAFFLLTQAGIWEAPLNSQGGSVSRPVGAIESSFQDRRNVYYVILDGYSNEAVLKNVVDLDISEFLHLMSDRGYFHSKNAKANYTTTHVSIMSVLEAEYFADTTYPYVNRNAFYPDALWRGEIPHALRKFYSEGYEFLLIGNAWGPCRQIGGVNCLGGGGEVGPIVYALNAFLRATPASRILDRLPYAGSAAYDAIKPLTELVSSSAKRRPQFVLAHHLAPHPPYVFTADCEKRMGPNDMRGERDQREKEMYRDAVLCVNKKILNLVDALKLNDPEAIVVIQADHGSDFLVNWELPLSQWSAAAVNERTSVLNLIRLPSHCRQWLRDDLAQVNTMRLVLGCLAGQDPQYLPEKSFLSTYEGHPGFGNVLDVAAKSAQK